MGAFSRKKRYGGTAGSPCDTKGNTYEYLWTGCTVFSYADQVGGHAAAAAMRNKTAAKKQSKKSKFKELIDMKKPVNIVHSDMADFLGSCVESFCELAKTSRATLKSVSTPFHDLRTAPPRESEKEPTGKLTQSKSGSDEDSFCCENGEI